MGRDDRWRAYHDFCWSFMFSQTCFVILFWVIWTYFWWKEILYNVFWDTLIEFVLKCKKHVSDLKSSLKMLWNITLNKTLFADSYFTMNSMYAKKKQNM